MVEFLNRYIGLSIENGYGTAGSTVTYGEVDSESLQHKFELLTRSDMSHHMATKSVVGTSYSEGGFDLAIQCDDFMGKLLYGCWPHQLTPVGTSNNPYLHTMLEPTLAAHTYPSFTITVGREEKEHTYTGMALDTLSLSANVGEYTMASASFVGKAESDPGALIATDAMSFSGDALDALHFADGEVTFHDATGDVAATAKVKSFSVDISMNRDTDNAYAIGNSTYTTIPAAQRREITGSLEFNQVVYTSATNADEPTYEDLIGAEGLAYSSTVAQPALKLKFTDTAGTEYFELDLYHLRFEAPEANVSGRDTNTMSVNFLALGQQGSTREFSGTTATSATVTVDAANAAKVKVGDMVNSIGIASGTYIIAKPSATTFTLSADATTSATETITILPNYTSSSVSLNGANLKSGIYAQNN